MAGPGGLAEGVQMLEAEVPRLSVNPRKGLGTNAR